VKCGEKECNEEQEKQFCSECLCQVVPDYVDVDASGFASNFLPGNNQGFLQQKITMKNNAMANGKPFKLQVHPTFLLRNLLLLLLLRLLLSVPVRVPPPPPPPPPAHALNLPCCS